MTGEWCLRWTDWFEFLGPRASNFMNYKDAQKCAQENGIKSLRDYVQRYAEINEELKKAGEPELPSHPDQTYKNSG